MNILDESLADKKTVVILGHVNPDGDCIGSCLGLRNYLKKNRPDLDVDVYLGTMGNKFSCITGYGDVKGEYDPDRKYDLCVTLDASDLARLGKFEPYIKSSDDSLCIDHHITNPGIAKKNFIVGEASSCCEVLYGLLDDSLIDKPTAECLYMGIAHDTGLFRYSGVTHETMDIAGRLIEKGIDFPSLIDRTWSAKSYGQTRLHGKAMTDSMLALDGRLIYSIVTSEEICYFGCTIKAVDGIIDELREVNGTECALLLYGTSRPSEYKVSMRSNSDLDVAKICAELGGGGHAKAAGATVTGNPDDAIEKICGLIRAQWLEMGDSHSGAV